MIRKTLIRALENFVMNQMTNRDQQKISIRFFDDREVRALWDEQNAKWWFSALDIIAVLTDQNDYTKTRNYWKYLKAKLKKENSEVVSATTQLKLIKNALTTEINSREMFMKGIDYSYYYEEV